MTRPFRLVAFKTALLAALLAAALLIPVSKSHGNSLPAPGVNDIYSAYGYAPATSPNFIPTAPNTGISFSPPTGSGSGSLPIEIFGGVVVSSSPAAAAPESLFLERSGGNNSSFAFLGVGSPVPDGSLTISLLGMALGGLALARRHVRA